MYSYANFQDDNGLVWLQQLLLETLERTKAQDRLKREAGDRCDGGDKVRHRYMVFVK